MAWSRRWLITTGGKWRAILAALSELPLDFRRQKIELIVREEVRPKSDRMRGLFHAVCDDVGTELGYWPGEFKMVVKFMYFGDDWADFSTEDLDAEKYGQLIECAYAIAADLGIVVPDRRTK